MPTAHFELLKYATTSQLKEDRGTLTCVLRRMWDISTSIEENPIQQSGQQFFYRCLNCVEARLSE